jgi:hypothetical protein
MSFQNWKVEWFIRTNSYWVAPLISHKHKVYPDPRDYTAVLLVCLWLVWYWHAHNYASLLLGKREFCFAGVGHSFWHNDEAHYRRWPRIAAPYSLFLAVWHSLTSSALMLKGSVCWDCTDWHHTQILCLRLYRVFHKEWTNFEALFRSTQATPRKESHAITKSAV